MSVTCHISDGVAIATLAGRLDGFTAAGLQSALEAPANNPAVRFIVLDLEQVNYLSSAAIRVFLVSHRKLAARQGSLVLAAVREYCVEVLNLTGFQKSWPVFDTLSAAVGHCRHLAQGSGQSSAAEHLRLPAGDFWIRPWSDSQGSVLVLGHIEDVLWSRITPAHIYSKRFSETEFSIGLGGLGGSPEDYLPILGEMITIGGTMVWLPTDGHDTPDYLIPRTDTGTVTIRTGFNVAQAGDFNEMIHFVAGQEQGATVAEIYRALFNQAKSRRRDFRGGLSLSMRAEMTTVFGSGVRLSPILENRPDNQLMITHPSNFERWFEIDREPRHRNVTGLLAGIGIDLTVDASAYDRDVFSAAFYVNPANPNRSDQVLHNHGVFFTPLPFPKEPTDLYQQIEAVVQQGDFADMRHLLDASRVREALIGVSYTQAFKKDPAGQVGHTPA